MLLAHFPGQKAGLDDSYNVAMMAIADAAARDKGKAVGEAAARLALAAGGFDPARTAMPYRPRTAPGIWTATAAARLPALFLHLQTLVPAELRLGPAAAPAGADQRALGARL